MKTIMSGKVISFPNGGRQVVTSAIERTPGDATILKTIATELARHPKGEKKLTDAQLDKEIDAIVDATGEILKRKNARERRAAEFKRQRQERMIEQMRSAAKETVNGVQLGWCMFWAIIYGGIDLAKRTPGALAAIGRKVWLALNKDSHWCYMEVLSFMAYSAIVGVGIFKLVLWLQALTR